MAQELMPPCPPALQLLYKSTGFIDELAWAAAWLYKATNTASYLADAKKYYSQVSTPDPSAACALARCMEHVSSVSHSARRQQYLCSCADCAPGLQL